VRLNILAIGKMKKGPESDLLDRYVDRAEKAGRQIGFSGLVVSQWNESRAADVLQRKNEEAALLQSSMKAGSFLIALDEHGKDIASTDLADLLRHNLDNSIPETAFAIGGPDGHGPEILKAANLTLRLGKMTWPHQLARVMLAEQIYRSLTILTGHPYHRV